MVYAILDNNFNEPLESIEKRVRLVYPQIKILRKYKKLKILMVDLDEDYMATLISKKTGLEVNKKDDSKGIYKEF